MTTCFRPHLPILLKASLALIVVCSGLLSPVVVRAQSLGPVEQNVSLDGTRLTYYAQNNGNQCQADCANNPNCRGYTWIQGGTYASANVGMCYLLSAVTARNTARGHYSAVKVSTAAAAPVGFLGCFRDSSAFDLNGSLVRSRSNSPAACAATCRQQGFAYAGVQYGESCLCGNSYGRYGPANNCNMRCTGDAGQICGGINANSVFATGVAAGGNGNTGGGVSPTVPASALVGEWAFHQCSGTYNVSLIIGAATSASTFTGGFPNGNGQIANARLSGSQVAFTRVVYADQVQDLWGTVVNDRGRLKMINGGWKGYGADRCQGGITNWTAEKIS